MLQALLRGDPTMQEKLNQMGVTSVMVHMFAAPSSPKIFEAALELGTALLDGGNTRVQKTIFTELSTSGSNDALASIALALNSACRKIQMCALARQPARPRRPSPHAPCTAPPTWPPFLRNADACAACASLMAGTSWSRSSTRGTTPCSRRT